jgi:hypothetical protein
VLTASALAFTLGAGPVSAAETSAATATATTPSTSSFSAASDVSAAGIPTSAIRFGSGTITSAAATRFYGTGTFSVEDATNATVLVNGRAKGVVPVLFSTTLGDAAIAVDVPRGWGSGRVQVNINGAVSNTFYARKQVKTTRSNGVALRIHRVNSKVTFSAYGIKIINPSSGKYVSLKRVKLQQFRGGKWRTKKTIKLKSSGNGSYKTTIKTKYRYRLYVPRTTSQEKFETIKTGKI